MYVRVHVGVGIRTITALGSLNCMEVNSHMLTTGVCNYFVILYSHIFRVKLSDG